MLSADRLSQGSAGKFDQVHLNRMSQNLRLVSVIVPSYNRSDALPATLVSLARQTLGPDLFEVIMVDDGSSDGSVGLIEELRPQLPYELNMLQQQNRGPGAARNRGVRTAHHDLLVFWDSDMVAAPEMLNEHARLQEESGPALVAGARRPWSEALTTAFARTMYGDRTDEDQFSGRTPSFQEMFSSNLSIPRQSFFELGGFDESLRAYEDVDFAYRAQQAGTTLLFSREALGYHNHPMTLEEACAQQRHYQSCAPALLHKHPELAGQLRHLIDKAPISWGDDRPSLVVRKLIRQALAGQMGESTLTRVVCVLERLGIVPRLRARIYMAILSSCALHGYREGLRAPHTPASTRNV